MRGDPTASGSGERMSILEPVGAARVDDEDKARPARTMGVAESFILRFVCVCGEGWRGVEKGL
jgi:hypothetical protein